MIMPLVRGFPKIHAVLMWKRDMRMIHRTMLLWLNGSRHSHESAVREASRSDTPVLSKSVSACSVRACVRSSVHASTCCHFPSIACVPLYRVKTEAAFRPWARELLWHHTPLRPTPHGCEQRWVALQQGQGFHAGLRRNHPVWEDARPIPVDDWGACKGIPAPSGQ